MECALLRAHTSCMPEQEAETSAGLQRTVADKKTISRIVDRAIAAGHVVRTAMRLQGRNSRDKVRQLEVLVCAGVPLDRALHHEVGGYFLAH